MVVAASQAGRQSHALFVSKHLYAQFWLDFQAGANIRVAARLSTHEDHSSYVPSASADAAHQKTYSLLLHPF